jgi:hypothetical protein
MRKVISEDRLIQQIASLTEFQTPPDVFAMANFLAVRSGTKSRDQLKACLDSRRIH